MRNRMLGSYHSLGQLPADPADPFGFAASRCPPGMVPGPFSGRRGGGPDCQPAPTTSSALASGVTTVPELSENPVARFAAIGKRLWMGPRPLVEYGPASATLRWSPGVQPTNVNALLDYAKITAVGTFVGIPVAALLGAYFGRRLKQNRRR